MERIVDVDKKIFDLHGGYTTISTISAILERYELKYIQGGVCKLVLSPASQI